MPSGFHALIGTQFVSGWADNALLIVAMAHLQAQGHPPWWAPLLKLSFTLAYVVLAPWVGPWADRVPKARLLWVTNVIKALGTLTLLWGLNPLVGFAVVGLGAAWFAPAKYGWVTENVASQRLVRANAWLEISLILAILLGVASGGALIAVAADGSAWAGLATSLGWPSNSLAGAWLALILAYGLAAGLSLRVPTGQGRLLSRVPAMHQAASAFWRANLRLWRDPLGGLSLAATSLFWAAGATMQLAVLQWAQDQLGMALSHAAYLQATVAIGVIVGAAWAAHRVGLRHAVRGLPLGLVLGVILIMAALGLNDWLSALPVMLLVGALSGYLVVPLNALLQYRGQRLLSAGQSIAIQGFNENASILMAMAIYASSLQALPSTAWAMSGLGAVLALGTAALWWRGARAVGGR
jgi:MFS family permease